MSALPACESAACHHPRREHSPWPRGTCMDEDGARCVGAIGTVACVVLGMVIIRLHNYMIRRRAEYFVSLLSFGIESLLGWRKNGASFGIGFS